MANHSSTGNRLTVRQWGAAIFVASAVIRLLLSYWRDYLIVPEGGEVLMVARNIAATGEFANPFGLPTGPTAHTAPIYTYFCAGLLMLFGNTPLAEAIRVISNTLASSLAFAMMPAWSERAGLGKAVGIGAGWFLALIPVQFYFDTKVAFEQPWATAAAVVLTYRLLGQLADPDWSAKRAACDGLFAGLAALLTPPLGLLPILGAAAEGWLLQCKGEVQKLRPLLLRTAIVGVVAGLTILPWTIRNSRVLGAWIFIRDNTGIEARTAFNDYQVTEMETDAYLVMHAAMHPHTNAVEARKLREVGEVEYNRQMNRAAWDWVGSHPMAAARLVAGNLLRFWIPYSDLKPWRAAFFSAMAPFYLWGLWILWRARRRYPLFWAVQPAIAFGLPLVCLLKTSIRYRYPVFWFFSLLAAVGVAELRRRFSPACDDTVGMTASQTLDHTRTEDAGR